MFRSPQAPLRGRRRDGSPADPAGRLGRLIALARLADLWERLWRGLIPPLVVAGLFLCVSWLGLWLAVPHWARAGGVALFALALALAGLGLLRLVPASRRDALRRIDRASGLAHRPASALDDRLAAAGRDPTTDALWALHRRRAETELRSLKVGAPAPRAAELDRYALRAGVAVALLACAVVAGPQRYARLAAAFDIGGAAETGPGTRIDAWIDPPPYTGKAPVLLDLASDRAHDPGNPLALSAPVGSTVIVRASGGSPPAIETSGPLLPPVAKKAEPGKDGPEPGPDARTAGKGAEPAPGDSETRLVLHGDSRLVLRRDGRLGGAFALTAVPDLPPAISLRELPKTNARGSFALATTTADDYGVAAAEARFSDPRINGEPVGGTPLVDPPVAALSLPGATHGIGDGETTVDLSDNPWAGAEVTMVLVARDEGGNEGRSEPLTLTLPQKPFSNPLARALVEQRRLLVLNPGRRADVATALDALMIEPGAFDTTAGAYLGLRFAADTLAAAHSKAGLLAVADFLWGMAQQIENGDLSDAEKALRNAEKELRDAIDRRASDEEIQKLTQNLQAAMDRFLKELAEQGDKGDKQRADAGRPSKAISQRDLQKLIERLKEQARSGNREEAKKALDELQDILENLKTAKRQNADPKARAMAQSLNQLDQMMRDQQDLRDETYRGEQQGQAGDAGEDAMRPNRNGRGSPGGQGQRRGGQGAGSEGEQGQAGQGKPGQGQPGRGGGKGLDQRQQELRNRLGEIQKRLKDVGEGERALGDAGEEMGEAEEALRQGQGSNGQAVDAQGRALDQLQKGARKLAESMKKQNGDGQGDGQGDQANSEGDGSQAGPDGQQSSDADPLGRPRGGNNTLNSNSRFDPVGVPAAQRAQRVLEELRRRLGDPTRPSDEIDYLERLLRSY